MAQKPFTPQNAFVCASCLHFLYLPKFFSRKNDKRITKKVLQKHVFLYWVLCQFYPASALRFRAFPWGGVPGRGTAGIVIFGAGGVGQPVFPEGRGVHPWPEPLFQVSDQLRQFSNFEISTIPELMPKFSSSLPAMASLA